MTTSAIGKGAYRVEDDEGRVHIVYVAGSSGDQWAFSQGHVFHITAARSTPRSSRQSTAGTVQPLASPMPATVTKVLVRPGEAVHKGDTLVVLEAMKMELPLRAPSDATVTAVHCREGDLVQPDAILVELQ